MIHFTDSELMSVANDSCAKMCYNPNAQQLITASKDDGAVEVYACKHNCMTKMYTAMNLFNNYSKNHSRYILRNEQLKDIRQEYRNSLFFYGSKDHQNL